MTEEEFRGKSIQAKWPTDPQDPPGPRIRHKHVRDQFEGKPLEGASLTPRGRPLYDDLYDTLDEANEAEQQDWTFFKGILLGVAITVAVFIGIQWGLMYYD